jgi:hypothetical protein
MRQWKFFQTKLKRLRDQSIEEELDELIHTALKTAKKEFAGVWESIGKGILRNTVSNYKLRILLIH